MAGRTRNQANDSLNLRLIKSSLQVPFMRGAKVGSPKSARTGIGFLAARADFLIDLSEESADSTRNARRSACSVVSLYALAVAELGRQSP